MEVDNRKKICILLKRGELTKAQTEFLEFCLTVGFGTLEVKVKDGEPVMSKVTEQWHKHDG